ncbi:hypothetical protein WMY93_015309 [Mugilogobius chulae]|uniref:NACHT domain-containing protein n=1 Tax=Mugilogobius chulae TaxID=88201 RepID=A0AAW0NSF9_9GOBI
MCFLSGDFWLLLGLAGTWDLGPVGCCTLGVSGGLGAGWVTRVVRSLQSRAHDVLLCLSSEIIRKSSEELKSSLKLKFDKFTEDFTELYIYVRNFELINQDHPDNEKTVPCEEIFKGQTQRGEPIRCVLTVGVAGVRKTVLTQKFSLDWAEGRTNQELQLLFLFTFRELNVLRDTQFSLVELLHHFFSPTKDLCSFQQLQVLFIFDGLDECRLPLDFSRTRVLD